ncbi:TetR/AcrR family transcriptional regulator [Cryobacterium sp. AP23]
MANGRPGRNRSAASWQAILEATRDELASEGYDRLSIDRIASAAGVGKQTVYRWYPSKSALVAECMLRGYVMNPDVEIADTGDARRDIAAWVDDFANGSQSSLGAALIRGGTAAAAEDEEIAARYSEVINKAESAIAARIEKGVELEQLSAATPAVVVAEILMGTLVYRVVSRQEITPEFVAELVGVVFGDAAV